MTKKVWTDEEKEELTKKSKFRMEQAEELLVKGIEEVFSSEKYADFLKFYSGFHQYSLTNMLLIMIQFPEASCCASYADWKKKGRHVKKGEKGLMIRVPTPKKFIVEDEDGNEEERFKLFFKVGSVFDISQTDGEPLPEICNKLTGIVENYSEIYDSICAAAGIPVTLEDFEGSANGFYSPTESKIVIRSGMSEAQTIKTLVHETAHSLLHKKGGEQEKVDRETAELQAESVAYIVCNYLGIDTSDYSFGYVAGWSKGKSSKHLEKNLTIIGKAAEKIIARLEGKPETEGKAAA